MGKQKPFAFQRYETLRGCFLAFLGLDDISDDELRHHEWHGYNGGVKFKKNVYKWLHSTKQKAWGWAEFKTKTVHYWCDDECELLELASLFAHEIAHLRKPRYKNKADEERKASFVGSCTHTAIEAATLDIALKGAGRAI